MIRVKGLVVQECGYIRLLRCSCTYGVACGFIALQIFEFVGVAAFPSCAT